QPRIPGQPRPPPPAEMSEREAEIWRDIVDARPLHYFGRENLPHAGCPVHAHASGRAAGGGASQASNSEEPRRAPQAASRLSKLGQRKHQTTEQREASGAPRRRLWQVE